MTAAALTLDAHMEMLRELRDKADQRGQTSAAIRAEELRGELRRFYVKQVESGDVGDFSRMSTEELRAYVYGGELPPKGPRAQSSTDFLHVDDGSTDGSLEVLRRFGRHPGSTDHVPHVREMVERSKRRR